MGCTSSKQNNSIKSEAAEVNRCHSVARASSAKSKDSGIELSYPTNAIECSSVSDSTGNNFQNDKSNRTKGIAFHVPAAGRGIIQKYPPKTRLSRISSSADEDKQRRGNLLPSISPGRQRIKRPDRFKKVSSHQLTLEELKKKQEEAEQRREAERLAVIARQRRRDLRAQKVIERKKQHQVIEENTDDLSDVDETFNVEEDFDWDAESNDAINRSESSRNDAL